jgi:hypothetical protein
MKKIATFLMIVALGAALGFALPGRQPARAAASDPNIDLGQILTLTNQAAGSVFSADLKNVAGHSAKCTVTITAVTAGSVTVTIYGKDGASGQYFSLLASSAIASPGQSILTVGPGLPVTSNVSANDVLPPTWRVGAAVVTGPASGTVGCSVIE